MNASDATTAPRDTVVAKGLGRDALGYTAAVGMALGSASPAYSLAATLGLLVSVGHLSTPALLILGFVPNFCVALAFQRLNAIRPDCGATFVWSVEAFGPYVGWMAGWAVILADLLAMSNLADVVGRYSFLLIDAPDLARNRLCVCSLGCAWIVAMTWFSVGRVRLAGRVQLALLALELAAILSFAAAAMTQAYSRASPSPDLPLPSFGWFGIGGIDSLSSLGNGLLSAVFLYWGWDTTVSLNEETVHPERTPGRSAIVATVILLLVYLIATVAAIALVGVGDADPGLANPERRDDVLAVLGSIAFGHGYGSKALILAVLVSTIAATQTTILPTARNFLSMAAHGALPGAFARVHKESASPTVSTIVMGIGSLLLYLGIVNVSEDVFVDTITAVTLVIAIYYSITCFACVKVTASLPKRGVRDSLASLWLPALGGLALAVLFVKGCSQLTSTAKLSVFGVGLPVVIASGGMLTGAVIMALFRIVRPSFFTAIRGS